MNKKFVYQVGNNKKFISVLDLHFPFVLCLTLVDPWLVLWYMEHCIFLKVKVNFSLEQATKA